MKKEVILRKAILLLTVCMLTLGLVGCGNNSSSQPRGENNSNELAFLKKDTITVKFPELNVDALKSQVVLDNDDLKLVFIDYVTANRQHTLGDDCDIAYSLIEMEMTVKTPFPISLLEFRLSLNGIPFDFGVHSDAYVSTELTSMIDRLHLDDLSWLDDTSESYKSLARQYDFKRINNVYDSELPTGTYRVLFEGDMNTYNRDDSNNHIYMDIIANNIYQCIDFKDGVVTEISGLLKYSHEWGPQKGDYQFAYVNYQASDKVEHFTFFENDESIKVYSDDNIDIYYLLPRRYEKKYEDGDKREYLSYVPVIINKTNYLFDLGGYCFPINNNSQESCEIQYDDKLKIRKLGYPIGPDTYEDFPNTASIYSMDFAAISFPEICISDNDSIDYYDGVAQNYKLTIYNLERRKTKLEKYEFVTDIITTDKFKPMPSAKNS